MDCFGTYSTHAQTCDVTRVESATQWTALVHTLPMPRETRVQETHLDDSPQTIFHTGFLFLTFRHRLLRYSWYLDKSGSQRATVKVGDPLATVKVGGRLATVRLAG